MNNLILAFSFLTNIRMPQVEFNKKNYKYLPLLFLIVGIVIGLLGYGLVYLLNITNFSSILKAVLITIYFAYITGGLHLDGLLDTVDSFLSRRDLEERLRIMHDSDTVSRFGTT